MNEEQAERLAARIDRDMGDEWAVIYEVTASGELAVGLQWIGEEFASEAEYEAWLQDMGFDGGEYHMGRDAAS